MHGPHACTCTCASSHACASTKRRQATEAATLVAVCRGARQLCLIGDQCQLPPTLVSRHPVSLRASVPLFSRLRCDGAPLHLLDTQYRMHPAIAQLPADLVYGGGLHTGVDAAERQPPHGFPWPRPELPVALLPVYGGGDGVSQRQGVCGAGTQEAA